MEQSTSKKKIVLAAILTSGLALAITQSAIAQPGYKGHLGQQHCLMQMDPVAQKAREKFLNETVETRKQLAEKNAVMRALMNAGTPDTTQASQIAGELFELREALRLKAQETGLPLPMLMMGQGGKDGMSCGQGPRSGRMNR
jgi:zinc resistance-associated protein